MNTLYLFIISLVALISHSAGSAIVGISGESLVQVKGKGSVLMKHVELGDRVLVSGNKADNLEYEPINSFAELENSEAPKEYLQIITTTARLEVSKDQMMFLLEGGRSITASSIKVDDQLSTAGIKNQLSVVKAIRTVVRDGSYAPVTASGTIVVNGIQIASSRTTTSESTLLMDSSSAAAPAVPVAKLSDLPQRVWCYFFVSCKGEQQDLDTSSRVPSVVYPLAAAVLFLSLGPFSLRIKKVSH